MKYLIIIAALCSFISILDLSSGYYTFLRSIISLIALLIIINEFQGRRFWSITFIWIFILFNPIIPIDFYFRSYWMIIIINTMVGLLFFYYFYTLSIKKKTKEPEVPDSKHKEIPRTRDRIIK